MLKKLQWRFIGAAMMAFVAVVLVLLCIINIWNYVNTARRQDETLQLLLIYEKEDKPPFPKENAPGPGPFRHFSPEVQYMTRFFTVHTDADGKAFRINQDYIASISKEDAINFAKQVQNSGQTSGYYEGYRYVVEPTAAGSITVFLNSERELQAIKSLLAETMAVAACCLLAVFILVVALSRRAIAPYVRNIETQKRFITDASHELKTPLTAITTSTDVLAMELEDNEWVKNIQTQTGRMAKLITDLVTLSRLDEEQPFPEVTDFSLSEAVWEITEPFAAIASASEKEYVQHIEENIQMRGDKAAIQQMVSILLDNALKYSDTKGKIRLDVYRKQRKTTISVYNTCHISDPQNIDRLFDRFYRSEASRSDRGSYGIGLSIAKAVAENHGGLIKAECVAHSAICFTVTF